MSEAINDSGELSFLTLNKYLGANDSNQLQLAGVFGAPNFSLNQIFFSTVGSDPPAAPINQLSLSQLRGKTFGIYSDVTRSILFQDTYTNASTTPNGEFPEPTIPIFFGYFGFGNSGILNPSNKGFPIAITIDSLQYLNISVSIKTGDGFQWETVNITGVTTTFITTTADAIRILGGRSSEDTILQLTVAPCLNQSGSGGLGRHKINITLTEGDGIKPPDDDPPQKIPDDGDEIIDDLPPTTIEP